MKTSWFNVLNTILKNAHDQEGKATNTLEKKKTSQECYQHLENRILGQLLSTGEKKRKGRGGGDSSLGKHGSQRTEVLFITLSSSENFTAIFLN
jgi:hypothetical protein